MPSLSGKWKVAETAIYFVQLFFVAMVTPPATGTEVMTGFPNLSTAQGAPARRPLLLGVVEVIEIGVDAGHINHPPG